MDKDFNTDTGQCRMNAPVLTGGLHGPERTLWPLTDETDWCGQHSALSMVISGEFQSVREAHDALQERFAAEGEAFGYVEGTKVPDWMGGDALPQSEPHWHIVQNVAQRLGAHRSREKSGRWNVPAFGRIGITAAELVDLDRATGSATLHQRPSPEMDPPRAPEPDLVFHRSPRVQAAARKLGATPAGWPVAEGKEAATLWRLPGQLASIGTAELLRLADNAK